MNLSFMYFIEHEIPSFRTFGYFINKVNEDYVEEIFNDINKKIFEKEQVDLQHLYIGGSEFPYKKRRMKKEFSFFIRPIINEKHSYIFEKSRHQKNKN